MKRVALIIQYDGSYFSGWQRQKNAISVQEIVEDALFKVSKQRIKTFAAGRTDAGVHASGQVVHFDIEFVIPSDRYADVLNKKLPQTIRILESVEVKIVGMLAILQFTDIIDMLSTIVSLQICF